MSARKRTEDGASAVEYGLIVFAIAGLITLMVFALGRVNQETFSDSCTTIRTGFDNAGMSVDSCS